MFYWFDPTYFLYVLPPLILMIFVQVKVKSTYAKYSKITNSKNITGYQAAEQVLRAHGLNDVGIVAIEGKMTDHYDPRANVIRLSNDVYHSASIAAVGIATHEAGHAVQHAKNYTPIKIRNGILPATQFGSAFAPMLLLFGFIFSASGLIYAGIILFSIIFLFQLVTLPVEFNASRRALQSIKDLQLLDGEDYIGARKMLSSAAMTYVAAMLQSLMTLLYYISRARRS